MLSSSDLSILSETGTAPCWHWHVDSVVN